MFITAWGSGQTFLIVFSYFRNPAVQYPGAIYGSTLGTFQLQHFIFKCKLSNNLFVTDIYRFLKLMIPYNKHQLVDTI